MKVNMKTTIFVSLLVFITMTLNAQEVEFKTLLQKDSIALGQPFKIEFQLSNAQGQFNGPDLSSFDILGGPNYTSSFSMINGETSTNMTYSYILSAREEGVHEIVGASVETSEGTIEAQPVSITVYFDPDQPTEIRQPNSPSRTKPNSKKGIRI